MCKRRISGKFGGECAKLRKNAKHIPSNWIDSTTCTTSHFSLIVRKIWRGCRPHNAPLLPWPPITRISDPKEIPRDRDRDPKETPRDTFWGWARSWGGISGQVIFLSRTPSYDQGASQLDDFFLQDSKLAVFKTKLSMLFGSWCSVQNGLHRVPGGWGKHTFDTVTTF